MKYKVKSTGIVGILVEKSEDKVLLDMPHELHAPPSKQWFDLKDVEAVNDEKVHRAETQEIKVPAKKAPAKKTAAKKAAKVVVNGLIIGMLLLSHVFGQLIYSLSPAPANPLAGKILTHKFPVYPGYSFEVSKDVAFLHDSVSWKMRLNWNDPLRGESVRDEWYIPGSDTNTAKFRFYSFWIYYPADFAYDTKPELSFQLQTKSPFSATGPNCSLWLDSDKWYIVGKYDSAGVRKQYGKTYLGKVIKGAWTNFIFQFDPATNSKGVVSCWLNFSKKFERFGPNIYTDNGIDFGVYPAGGDYKWIWKGLTVAPKPASRTVYFGRIRTYGAASTINDVITAEKALL